MSNNVEPVKPIVLDSESDPEENASFEDASSDSDSEPEPNQLTKKSPALPPATLKNHGYQSGSKAQTLLLPSDDKDSGSEPEPESDSDSSDSDPILSLIAAKAREGAKKSNGGAEKSRSKPKTVTPAKSIGKRRAPEGKEAKAMGSKRSKKNEVENSDKKPSEGSQNKILFGRFFSEADEIAILKGMIAYADKYSSDPFGDTNAFRDFIKDDLQADPTRDQLWYKMLKFEKKYEKNKQKEESGRCRSLKAHERRAYELSKHVWAIENEKGEILVGSSRAAKKRGAKKAHVGKEANNAIGNEGFEKNTLKKLVEIVCPNDIVSMDKNIARIGDQMLGGKKRVERENEWQKLTIAEMDVYLKKLDLMVAKTKVVLDVLKVNDY